MNQRQARIEAKKIAAMFIRSQVEMAGCLEFLQDEYSPHDEQRIREALRVLSLDLLNQAAKSETHMK